MSLNSKTCLLCAAIFMVGIAVVTWRYLESDSPAPETLRAPSAERPSGNSITQREPVEPSAISSSSTGALADSGLSGAAPLSLSLAEVLASSSRFERHQLLEQIGFDAANEGIEAALDKLAEITIGADRAAFLRGMFAHLAENPEQALRAVKSLGAGIDRETAVAALVANWRAEP